MPRKYPQTQMVQRSQTFIIAIKEDAFGNRAALCKSDGPLVEPLTIAIGERWAVAYDEDIEKAIAKAVLRYIEDDNK